MALLQRFNKQAKAENETGLSANGNLSSGRFFNKNGNPNMEVRGMHFFAKFKIYHSKEDIKNVQAEVLVFVQGFDESFANTVISRNSYTFEEFVYRAKFLPMYHGD